MSADLDDDLRLAHELADRAAEIALGYFGRPTESSIKADGSPVGETDLAVERALLEMLAHARPDDAVLSEESGTHGASGRRWIIDPIDGTVPFLAGDPEWGTHVALEVEGEVALGVVTRPTDGRRWWAVQGQGTFRREGAGSTGTGGATRVELSDVSELTEARITGWRPKAGHAFDAVARAGLWRDCALNDLTIVLDGRAELMVVPGRVWDHAPFLVLLEEAGGSLIDKQGGRRLDLGTVLYTNGRLDAAVRELMPSPDRGDASGA